MLHRRRGNRILLFTGQKTKRPGEVKAGHCFCFSTCCTRTPTGIPLPGERLQNKACPSGKKRAWLHTLYREGGHLRLCTKKSLWSVTCRHQPCFLRCWCHLEKQGAFLTKTKWLPLWVAPASHRQGHRPTQREEGKNITDQTASCSQQWLLKKNPHLHLSNTTISNNVQQKYCRKLFLSKQTKEIIHFKAKLQCTALHSRTQMTM